MPDDLSFSIEAQDQFSSAFRELERLSRSAERNINSLNRTLRRQSQVGVGSLSSGSSANALARSQTREQERAMQAALTFRRVEVREAKKAAAQETAERRKVTEAALRFRRVEVQAAERAAREQVRAADRAAREGEQAARRLAAAQERYQLAIRDTAGQIDFLKAKLRTLDVQSPQFFETRTRIAQLEGRLTRPRQGAFGDAVAPAALRGFAAGGLRGAALTGGTAVLGTLTAFEAGRVLVEQGKIGASNEQLARSFETLSRAIGLSADSLRNELNQATQQTIADNRLMAESNLLLSAAQQQGIGVTEEQIGKLAQLARLRSTQLSLEGRQITTEEAFGRLIRGSVKRETELLDELGLSTKQLADVMGVSVKEINADVETLLNALIKVADIEIAKFGDPIEDEATKIQQAEKRITDALDRIRANAATPARFVVEIVAEAAEGAAGLVDQVSDVARQATSDVQRSRNDPAQILQDRLDRLNLESVNASFSADPRLSELGQQIDTVGAAIRRLGQARKVAEGEIFVSSSSVEEEIRRYNELDETLLTLSRTFHNIENLDAAGVMSADEIARLRGEWAFIVELVGVGTTEALKQADAAAQQLSASAAGIGPALAPAIGAANSLTIALEQAVGNMSRIAAARAVLSDNVVFGPGGPPSFEDAPAFAQDVLRSRIRTNIADDKRELAAQDDLRAAIDDELRTTRDLNAAQFRYQRATTDTTGEIALLNDKLADLRRNGLEGTVEYINTQTDLARLNERLANEQERAGKKWISTIEQMESAFESAISSIQGIPGFSGRTPVTEDDLRLAKFGVRRDEPDEALRRIEDVLVNKVPRKDVDLAAFLKATSLTTGIDQKDLARLPGDLLFKLIEEEFTSGRIFGTDFVQKNLDKFLNQDAIGFGLQQQGLANQGRQFLLETFKGGELPNIFAQAGGFVGKFDEALNAENFAGGIGNIFQNQLTSEPALEGVTKATPAVVGRFRSAILSELDDSGIGAAILIKLFNLVAEAQREAGQ